MQQEIKFIKVVKCPVIMSNSGLVEGTDAAKRHILIIVEEVFLSCTLFPSLQTDTCLCIAFEEHYLKLAY